MKQKEPNKEIILSSIQQPIRKVGVFDSGLGGLTILKELLKLPFEEYIYLADTAYLPYGDKSKEELRIRAEKIMHFFILHKVDLIIAACHTISIHHSFFAEKKIPVIGMIKNATQCALTKTKVHMIGIMATPTTIASHAHKKALLSINPSITVIEQSCPELVPLLEQEQSNEKKLTHILNQYLEPFHKYPIDTLILGCTHYSLIKQEIQKQIGPSISLISSDESIYTLLDSLVIQKQSISHPHVSFFVSSEPFAFKEKSKRLLSWSLDKVKEVSL